MTNTERHNLPQWEKSDRIRMEDFNAAMAALDAAIPKIAAGRYTGNGAASRTISLPFTPKAVLVTDSTGRTCVEEGYSYAYGGLAVEEGNVSAVSITTNGFIVRYNTSSSTRIHGNNNNTAYNYLAIG